MGDLSGDSFAMCGSFAEGMLDMPVIYTDHPVSHPIPAAADDPGMDDSVIDHQPSSPEMDLEDSKDSSLSPDIPRDADAEGENYGMARISAVMRECRNDPSIKPGLSYIALISLAIQDSPDQRLLLADIYQWIVDKFPYYGDRDRSWRNSVRHNLSLNECFIKTGRADNGKGNYWAVHPACAEDFLRGDFRRRRARRRVRHCNDHMEKLQMGLITPNVMIKEERADTVALSDNCFVPMSCTTASVETLVGLFGPEAILGANAKVHQPSASGSTNSLENTEGHFTAKSSCMFGNAVPFPQMSPAAGVSAVNLSECSGSMHGRDFLPVQASSYNGFVNTDGGYLGLPQEGSTFPALLSMQPCIFPQTQHFA